ncbi:hypothetical protein [Serratia symbiotica]|uniref:hypothetical protein n=1 Tax=Serratia symbiotica TaxID=138074 RepID=UPI0004ABFFAB
MGNLQNDPLHDLEKPDIFERWASSEALDKPGVARHFQLFVSQVDGKLDMLGIKRVKKDSLSSVQYRA